MSGHLRLIELRLNHNSRHLHHVAGSAKQGRYLGTHAINPVLCPGPDACDGTVHERRGEETLQAVRPLGF